MPAAYTPMLSVQVLDFEDIGLLIRHVRLVCDSCSSGQQFACGFLQIKPRDGHPCRPASNSPYQACRGFSPPSHSHTTTVLEMALSHRAPCLTHQEQFGQEVYFLHGGVSKKKRDEMVERFQSDDGPSMFVLSLKAGGTGLNLTRANHVFHFDRWWNSAVENQATDRVFRIGQTKDVQVHKFLCVGTLEEKIDAMIESKKEIADGVVGTGEGWLTELSTDELKDLFALSKEADSY